MKKHSITINPDLRLAELWRKADEQDTYDMDRQTYFQECADAGLEIKQPLPNQLFLDFDSDKQYENFLILSKVLERNLAESVDVKVYPSKSGLPHRHAIVSLPWRLSGEWERLAWQAALGSDPVRELLSCVRNLNGEEWPTIFAEPKGDSDVQTPGS